MNSMGSPILWGGFSVIVILMLVVDLLVQKNNKIPMTFKQSVIWSVAWVTLALLFNLALWCYLSLTHDSAIANTQAMAFLAGYLIEKSLAIDNVFVWLIIFSYFSIPLIQQKKVLLFGVLGAVVLRTIMIFTGSWLINQFQWIFYLFGIFLVFTSIKMALPEKNGNSLAENKLVILLKRHLRVSDYQQGDHFFIKKEKLCYATPLFLVLILIELSDIIFAVDSIPAVFAVTTDPFIVLTSNLFAILGLRAMYFLLANVADKFSLLKYGLAIVLLFIGLKLLLIDLIHISVFASLLFVGLVLFTTLVINIYINRQQ